MIGRMEQRNVKAVERKQEEINLCEGAMLKEVMTGESEGKNG